MAKININMDALKPSKEWKRHKVLDGDNIYRILPPFGDPDTHKNVPFKKWSVIWGLTDPETGRMKPFNSPMNSTERKCPVSEYLAALTEKVEVLTKAMEADGFSKDEIKDKLSKVNRLLWELRPKHIYSYNACDKSGTVGILDIKSTAHKAMKKCMMVYINDYSQDPTSLSSDEDDSGVWFNITREGEGKNTEYGVKINSTREKDDRGRLVSIDDRSALPENVMENYDDLGYDLHNLYVTKSYDDLKNILALNLNEIIKEIPEAAIEGYLLEDVLEENMVEEKVVEKKKSVKKSTKKVALSMGADDEEDDTPVVASKATKAVTKKVEPVVEAKTKVDVSDDDDFMSMAENILNS